MVQIKSTSTGNAAIPKTPTQQSTSPSSSGNTQALDSFVMGTSTNTSLVSRAPKPQHLLTNDDARAASIYALLKAAKNAEWENYYGLEKVYYNSALIIARSMKNCIDRNYFPISIANRAARSQPELALEIIKDEQLECSSSRFVMGDLIDVADNMSKPKPKQTLFNQIRKMALCNLENVNDQIMILIRIAEVNRYNPTFAKEVLTDAKNAIIEKGASEKTSEAIYSLLEFAQTRPKGPMQQQDIKFILKLAAEATQSITDPDQKRASLKNISRAYKNLGISPSNEQLTQLLEIADSIPSPTKHKWKGMTFYTMPNSRKHYWKRIAAYRELHKTFGDQILKVKPSLMWVIGSGPKEKTESEQYEKGTLTQFL